MNLQIPIRIKELQGASSTGGACLVCFRNNTGPNSLAIIVWGKNNIGRICDSCRFAGQKISKAELNEKLYQARQSIQAYDPQMAFLLTEIVWQVVAGALDSAEMAELPGATH